MAKNTLYGISCFGENETSMLVVMEVSKKEFDRQHENMMSQLKQQEELKEQFGWSDSDLDYPITKSVKTSQHYDGIMTLTAERFSFGQCDVNFYTCKLVEGRTFKKGLRINDILRY